SEDAWINTFQVRTAPEEGGVSRARLREAALKASAKPVLSPGSSVEVLVSGFGVSPPSGAFSFELLDGRGEVVGSWVSTLKEPEEAPGDRPGAKWLTGSIDLSGELDGLVAGEYLLRAKAPGESGAPVYSPTLPVIVASDTGEFSTWAAVNRLETLDEPVGSTELPSPKKRTKLRAKDVKALKKRYAAILGLSTGRDRAAAPRALRSYEQEAVTEFGERGLPSLVAAEMGLIKGLGREDPEALIPVARLHHQAYREHRSRRAFLLATHARNLALAIVELYIDGGTSEESERGAALRQKDARRVVASRLLASFGGDLQRAGLRRFSERLFRRALECDDENEAALLGMGASFEKYSEYEEAAKYFERLVAARPESGEGRLRLGINHWRLGRKAKARKQLEQVIMGDHERWVQSLAYQELVQMSLRADDMEPAADLLGRALERFPDEPKLYLQLAYLRNAVGEPWRAQAELDRLSRVREPEVGDSPRYAYSNWPVEALDRVWARSEEDVLSRLEALQAVLPAGAEGGAP
ncbi:MAG: tetratricopeptide repeat protein, partial [bacterium]|nr:tetratricopeptide repeat protein [bacterium]